jgi:hypothetical protein
MLEYLKSWYNMTSPIEMYETMVRDEIGKMMLEKRDINSSSALEKLLYKHLDEL